VTGQKVSASGGGAVEVWACGALIQARIWCIPGMGSAAIGDLDGDVGGLDGGDGEHSWFRAEFVGGLTAEQ